MKELSIEEKAKCYNEAIERAKAKFSNEEVEDIFPELKESEDERMRNVAINACKYMVDNFENSTKQYEDAIVWLENQGEPIDKGEISDGYHTFNELYYYRMLYNAAFFNLLPKELVHKSKRHHRGEECLDNGWFIVMAQLPTGQISNHYELKYWNLFHIQEKEMADEWDGHSPQEAAKRLHEFLLMKQDEQEQWDSVEPVSEEDKLHLMPDEQSSNKVEPKFRVGDTMRTKQEAADCYTDGMPVVIDVDKEYYHCTNELIAIKDQDNYEYPPMNRIQKPTDKVEQKFKVGDLVVNVEVVDADKKELKKIEQKPTPKYKVGDTIYYNSFGKIESMVVDNIITDSTDNPMYEDKEGNAVFEKDLIEQKPAWSEEDEKMLNQVIEDIERLAGPYVCYYKDVDWLKSLKDRVQPQQKQEWSEDDNFCIDNIMRFLTTLNGEEENPHYLLTKLINWLKSLRPQNHWKPSDEQMKILRKYVMGEWRDLTIGQDKVLTSLYQDLQKLREE